MNQTELQSWVAQIASSADQQAFKRLFLHFYDYLFYFSNSFVKSREAAEEIVQDVFVSLWKKRETLPRIDNLRVYLYVSVRNLSVNYLRRSGFHYDHDLNQLDVSCVGAPSTPEELMVATEVSQRINRSVAELPPRCRLVYKLVKEDGLRYREVAEILHISPRTVENQIGTALRKIAADIHIDFKTRSFHDRPLKKP